MVTDLVAIPELPFLSSLNYTEAITQIPGKTHIPQGRAPISPHPKSISHAVISRASGVFHIQGINVLNIWGSILLA